LVSPTANLHHGCHNGHSHEAVDDRAPKQRFDGIERGEINPNSEDGCGDDYAVKADRLSRLILQAAFPALCFSEETMADRSHMASPKFVSFTEPGKVRASGWPRDGSLQSFDQAARACAFFRFLRWCIS
jgi:hypothetical protein